MANPFGEAIGVVGEGIANFAFPNTLARRRQRKETAAMREAFSQSLQTMPPQVQETLRPFVENDEAFGELLENPQILTHLGQGTAAVNPPPAEMEGDDILTLFNRGAEFAQQGDTRRAELMLSAAANKAGIDLSQDSTGPFGSGFKGRSFGIVNQLAPAAFEGQLNDDQGRLLDTALAAVMQPVPFQDPITRQTLMVEPTLPPFIQQLAEQRGVALGATQPSGTAPVVGADGAAPQLEAPAGEGGEQQNIFAALPSGNSIVEQADNLAGPIDAAIRNLSSLTGLGGLVDEQVGAERLAADATELIVDALQTETSGTTRAVSERERLRKTFGFTPEAFGNRQNIVERGAQGWLAMDQREQEILHRLANPGETTGEQKKRDRDALAKIRQAKPRVSPPVLQSAQEIQEFIASSAAGDRFVMRDPDDPKHPWITVEVEGSQ